MDLSELEIIRRSAVMARSVPSSIALRLVDEVKRLHRELAALRERLGDRDVS